MQDPTTLPPGQRTPEHPPLGPETDEAMRFEAVLQTIVESAEQDGVIDREALVVKVIDGVSLADFSLEDDQMHAIVHRVYGSSEDVSDMLGRLTWDQRMRWYPGNVRRLLNWYSSRSSDDHSESLV
ncbi:MAG TPA: hypothetical protein VIH90_08335 [Candidatus Saccharimonadales bacterium]